MQSSFLYLHSKKLTLTSDSQEYQQANSALYRREGFRFLYMVLLCKLYDMSSFPISRNRKMYIYSGVVMAISSLSFWRASLPLTDMLIKLDEKYEETYKKYLREKAYEGVA